MTLAEPNYFKVNRGLLHSDRWLSEPFTRGQAWIDLFGLAQHSKGFFRVRGIKVNVERGQLAYSQLSLAKRWGWSVGKVRRYLNELENNQDIVQQNNEVTTIISIVKYNYWQGEKEIDDTTDEQQKDNRRTTDGRHTKNDNKKENDKEEYNKQWLVNTPKKDIDYFNKKYPHISYEEEKEKAINWLNMNGKRYKNYKAFLENWLKKGTEFANEKQKIEVGDVEIPEYLRLHKLDKEKNV